MSAIDQLLLEARHHLPHRPTADELPALRERGALLIDIRPSEQRSVDGELGGAIVIPRNVLEWRLDPSSDHRIREADSFDREIVVVCDEGYQDNDGNGACYACLYNDEDEWLGDCQGNGVLAPVPGVIGTLMAEEALKLALGWDSSLRNRLLLWDAKRGDWQNVALKRDPDCVVCRR